MSTFAYLIALHSRPSRYSQTGRHDNQAEENRPRQFCHNGGTTPHPQSSFLRFPSAQMRIPVG